MFLWLELYLWKQQPCHEGITDKTIGCTIVVTHTMVCMRAICILYVVRRVTCYTFYTQLHFMRCYKVMRYDLFKMLYPKMLKHKYSKHCFSLLWKNKGNIIGDPWWIFPMLLYVCIYKKREVYIKLVSYGNLWNSCTHNRNCKFSYQHKIIILRIYVFK